MDYTKPERDPKLDRQFCEDLERYGHQVMNDTTLCLLTPAKKSSRSSQDFSKLANRNKSATACSTLKFGEDCLGVFDNLRRFRARRGRRMLVIYKIW